MVRTQSLFTTLAAVSLLLSTLAACDAATSCDGPKSAEELAACALGQPDAGPATAVAETDAAMVEPACQLPGPNQLVINEILADPGGLDSNGDTLPDSFDDEFIELVNATGKPLEMGGVGLRVGSAIRFRFPSGCLPPGEPVVVFGGGRPALTDGAVFVARLMLTNGGQVVSLLAADGDLELDRYAYTQAEPGRSFTRAPDGTGSWGAHPEVLGTGLGISPGGCHHGGAFPYCPPPALPEAEDEISSDEAVMADAPACSPPAQGELVVNELLADPGTLDGNGDGRVSWQQDEFVELLVVADTARDLTGIQLRINGKHRVTLPAGCHPPGQGFVVFSGDSVYRSLPGAAMVLLAEKALGLGNTGGQLELLGAFGHSLDKVEYGPEAGDDEALTRYPDGIGHLMPHSQTLFGGLMSPGRCSSGEPLETGCPGAVTGEALDE